MSATATLWSGGSNEWCDVTSGPPTSGDGSGAGYIQAAETGLVTVPVNGIVSEACEGTAADQDEANAGVMAIRINSSSLGTTSPCARTPTRLPRDRSDC